MSSTNKLSYLALALALAALAVAVLRPDQGQQTAPSAKQETAYERVMRTGVLRCGYGTWEPGVYKDPASGQMAGLFVELMSATGKLNNLNIEWTAEIDWGQIPQALLSGKIDAFCAGMAGDAARGKQLAYTNPLSYWRFDVLVRADDTRFPEGNSISAAQLNNSQFSTAFTEGDVLETIAKNELPAVKGIPLPPLGTPADNLMNVVTGKTDFVIFPRVMFQGYDKQNPNKLRYLSIDPPLKVYGNVIATDFNDLRLQQLLNAGINELVNSAKYVEIMRGYNQQYPDAFQAIKAAQ
jgi:ABC-type amino acid transport substrate-binding protein